MPTRNQLKKNPRSFKKNRYRLLALQNNPQKKGYCFTVFVTTPRKPNSALRKVTKVQLKKRRIIAFIPGIGHNLQKFSTVLLRGGNVKDLPSIKYKVIRGVYDVDPVYARRQGRSKYGNRNLDLIWESYI
jgi:small subunit ribosomal protein S12